MEPVTVKRKVLFADSGPMKFSAVVEALEKANVASFTVQEADKLLHKLALEKFDILVLNLLLGGTGPFQFIENIKKNSINPDLKIIVVTRQIHKLNIQNTMAAGAHDFIGDPFEMLNLYHRILYHMGPVKVIERDGFEKSMPSQANWNFVKLLLEANEQLSKIDREKIHEVFFKILRQIASLTNSNRSSMIIVDETTNAGVVLASSDDQAFSNFPIKLDKYPEVLHVLHTGNLVVVEDVSQNILTDRINTVVKTIAIGSMMVFPVFFQGAVVGVLNIRRQKATELPPMETLRIIQAVANLMAAHADTEVRLRRLYKNFNAKPVA